MHSYNSCAPPAKTVAAFTLLEIMIAVAIIGLLAMIALPGFTKIRRSAQTNRFVSDLRTFAQAFETYSIQNGSWPATAAVGVVPTGMSGDIKPVVWASTNSLGGAWSWDNESSGIGIVTSNVTVPLSQLVEIDARIDDGDLSNGLFRQVAPTKFIYLLQPP